MKYLVTLLAAATLSPFFFSAHASAQVPVEAHVHAGMAFPRGDWKNYADNGLGYGFNLNFLPLRFAGFYIGYDRFQFDVEGAELQTQDEFKFVDGSIRAGIELRAPLGRVSPFIAGGATYGEGLLEYRSGSVSGRYRGSSDLGYEAAAGLDISVGQFRIRPKATYRTREAAAFRFASEGIVQEVDFEPTNLQFTIGAAFIP